MPGSCLAGFIACLVWEGFIACLDLMLAWRVGSVVGSKDVSVMYP